ncbi:MAG: TIGR02921 family PEP-CTERM protein [Alphaproteobacteria bacterium]|nr:TIGR02921 family PEP-CTERM protein [Alphaproteobacteria bacterium]
MSFREAVRDGTIVAHAVFWPWHVLYVALLEVKLGPEVAAPVVRAAWQGQVPLGLAAIELTLMALPVLSVAVGYLRFRAEPLKLMRLFFGVTLPAVFMLWMRVLEIREVTAAVGWVSAILGVGVAAVAVELFVGLPRLSKAASAARLVGHSAALLGGLYAAVLLGAFLALLVRAFLGGCVLSCLSYVPPLGRGLPLQVYFLLGPHAAPAGAVGLWYGIMALGFPLLTALLWGVAPAATLSVTLRSFGRAARVTAASLGWPLTLTLTAGTVGAGVAGFVWTTPQPQRAAFEALERLPGTDAERQALLARSEVLRAGLLNAWLAEQRYVDTEASAWEIGALCQAGSGVSPAAAQAVQEAWNVLAAPFLYQDVPTGGRWRPVGQRGGPHNARSVFRGDRVAAERHYARLFDAPIQRGERDTLLRSMASSRPIGDAEAELVDIDARRVRVAEQIVTIVEHPGVAELELYEVYEGLTAAQHEVSYTFTLPPGAALTGLWLGTTPDRTQAQAHAVTPRGAAQEIQLKQVHRERGGPLDRLGPATLEQVGPRQYRLRLFPVPVQSSIAPGAERLHVWMGWTTLGAPQGWPMPQLIEQRNVYRDADTVRDVSGEVDASAWLPAFADASSAAVLAPRPLAATLADGTVVRATPLDETRAAPRPEGLRLAVVLDTSRSMAAHADAVMADLRCARDGFARDNAVDLYLARSPHGAEAPGRASLDTLTEPLWYGGHTLYGVIEQLLTLSEGQRYDAVLVLTDAGSEALLVHRREPWRFQDPLWIVHVDGALAPWIEDTVLDAVTGTGGGVALSLDEAVARIARLRSAGPDTLDLAGGYRWHLDPQATAVSDSPGFAPLAARQHILALSRQVDLGEREPLDVLHDLAVDASVVTPFSSMVAVFGTYEQWDLGQESKAAARFRREPDGL